MLKKALHWLSVIGFLLAAVLPAQPGMTALAAEGEPPTAQETQTPETPADPLAASSPSWAEALDAFDDYGYEDSLLPFDLKLAYDVDDPWWVSPDDCPTTDPDVTNGMKDVVFPVISPNAVSAPIYFRDPYTPSDSFEFPFYENKFSAVEVGINGVVRLTTGSQASDFVNYPLPTGNIIPAAPTNMIAALWANLDFSATPPTTVKYCYFYNLSPYFLERSLVIEWDNVVREGTNDLFSFGVALQQSGRIVVLLKDIPATPGNLTIGIQDLAGEDGLLYHYNGVGTIGDLKAIVFTRPSPTYHVKVSPAWQGQFTQNGKAAFILNLLNNTDLVTTPGQPPVEPNYYDFTSTQEPDIVGPADDWKVEYFTADGLVQLTDTPADPGDSPDTFPEYTLIDAGQSLSVMVKVTAPPGTTPGTYRKIKVTVNSHKTLPYPFNVAKPITVNLQAAVPSAFVVAFQDSEGLKTDLIWEKNTFTPKVNDAEKNNLEIGDWLGGYSLAWTEKLFTQTNSSVSYAFLDSLGFVKYKVNDIDKSNSDSDEKPALAVETNSGDSGLAWVRQKTASTEIRFAVLNASLPAPHIKFSVAPLRTISDTGQNLLYPAVSALGGGEFLVAWVEPGTDYRNEIWAAKVSNTGSITGPTKVYTSTGLSGTIYALSLEPVSWLVDAKNVRSVLTFVDLVGETATTQFAGLTSSAPIELVRPTLLSTTASHNSYATSMAAVSGGKVLIAWVDSRVDVLSKSGIPYTVQSVKYALLTSSFALPTPLYSLMAPNLRQADYLSVGTDKNGNAIFIWSDFQIGEYFYYALVNPNPSTPSFLSPAMIYATKPGGSPSASGQSVAVYNGREVVYLPITRK